jgi:short subunit dehydrogenase-like uncharacterized protein
MNANKKFDVIVFGATGFTGRLVAQYLLKRYGVGGDVAWAIAGRSAAKLAEVRQLLGAPETLPILTADASDQRALMQLVAQTKVVLTTVGPYQRYGEPLARACATAGTDYVDLCGEPVWMAQMIPVLEPLAKASGARIVFSCGFDSIPFDLGVVFLQDEAERRFGRPLRHVHGRVKRMKGGASGGTIASMLATLEAIRAAPALARTLRDPFALTPGFKGPRQPPGSDAAYDELAHSWTGPFVMAPINTKNVHRTNALRGHPWGQDFVYDERMMTGDGDKGRARARNLARMSALQMGLLSFAPTRALLKTFALPKPGQGPSAAEQEQGHYEVLFIGESADGRMLSATVKGDRDPGYGSTCKLVAEAALCLARDVSRAQTAGGVWTPGSAMGLTLQRRLYERAGLTFQIN